MTKPKILLFLHGVGDGDPENRWQKTLESALMGLGYPSLSDVIVVAPKYPKGLNGVDDEVPLPKVIAKALRGDEAKAHRRDYERRRTAMERLLGPDDEGEGIPGANAAMPLALDFKAFAQAEKYLNEPKIRAWVLDRVLKQLPDAGRVVIVGHSLGSVIAADLIRRLHTDLEVTGMVTLGSPLAHKKFHVDDLRTNLAEPPANLAWWVNFWSSVDAVAARRGVSSAFPWVLDQRISAPVRQALSPLKAHSAQQYLQNPAVALAIGRGLFGSRSTEIVHIPPAPDIALDPVESLAVLALRYAHLTARHLEGDTQARYDDALRQVQAAAVDQIATRNRKESRALPRVIAELAVDLSDPSSQPSEPRLPGHWSTDDAVLPLTILASGNVLRPFEIDVSDAKRQKALEQLTLDMRLGRKLGRHVFEAIEQAKDELKGPTNWFKWTALGLGAAALVVVTSGLALAAAPGAAGAAATTSALAAFGPGGMLGGLVTAGTLVGAGGGGIAAGLAAPGTTAESVEAVVATQLTTVILRRIQGLSQDPTTWRNLNHAEREMRRELARLSPLSDRSAPGVKALQRKLQALRRAIDYIERNGLQPSDIDRELPETTSTAPRTT